MNWSLKNMFNPKLNTNSVKNNNVKIITNNDMIFQIGKDLGEIKTLLESLEVWKIKVDNKLKNLDNRIKKIESKINV